MQFIHSYSTQLFRPTTKSIISYSKLWHFYHWLLDSYRKIITCETFFLDDENSLQWILKTRKLKFRIHFEVQYNMHWFKWQFISRSQSETMSVRTLRATVYVHWFLEHANLRKRHKSSKNEKYSSSLQILKWCANEK